MFILGSQTGYDLPHECRFVKKENLQKFNGDIHYPFWEEARDGILANVPAYIDRIK